MTRRRWASLGNGLHGASTHQGGACCHPPPNTPHCRIQVEKVLHTGDQPSSSAKLFGTLLLAHNLLSCSQVRCATELGGHSFTPSPAVHFPCFARWQRWKHTHNPPESATRVAKRGTRETRCQRRNERNALPTVCIPTAIGTAAISGNLLDARRFCPQTDTYVDYDSLHSRPRRPTWRPIRRCCWC